MTYWNWAIEVHGRPGVDDALTGLQDANGQCVAYLLWAAWAAQERRALPPEILMQGAALAKHWEGAATMPLRSARRHLKRPAPPIADDAREALREQVRKIEFAAERLLMETLESLAPDPDAGASALADALVAASLAWSRTLPEAELRELAARLG
ncbi:MAG TPA: TIGR02444 family protein [Caulobacteraceae bacterium]